MRVAHTNCRKRLTDWHWQSLKFTAAQFSLMCEGKIPRNNQKSENEIERAKNLLKIILFRLQLICFFIHVQFVKMKNYCASDEELCMCGICADAE